MGPSMMNEMQCVISIAVAVYLAGIYIAASLGVAAVTLNDEDLIEYLTSWNGKI